MSIQSELLDGQSHLFFQTNRQGISLILHKNLAVDHIPEGHNHKTSEKDHCHFKGHVKQPFKGHFNDGF